MLGESIEFIPSVIFVGGFIASSSGTSRTCHKVCSRFKGYAFSFCLLSKIPGRAVLATSLVRRL
jgi:hypothetical protein